MAKGRDASGCVAFVLCEHPVGEREQLFIGDGPGAEADAIASVIARGLACAAQHQYRQIRHARMKFGDKHRTSDAGHMVAGDDQAKIHCELGLLDQAKRLSRIGDAFHVSEFSLQDGLAQRCLKRIVVY